MTEPIWRVVVAQEIDDEAREALTRIGAVHISGHSMRGLESNTLLVRADTEELARERIRDALGQNVVIREARLTPAIVYAPIPPEAIRVFQEAAGEDERVGGVIENEETGEAEVYFELIEGGFERALNEARGLYRRFMEAAGLEVPEDLELTISGFEVFMSMATRDRQLLERARELLAREEFDLSVVLAQTASEVLIADTLRGLLSSHVSDELQVWLLARIRQFSLNDDSTRDLWDRVTGTHISGEDFWEDYKRHVKRRHLIVHEGARASQEDAQASVAAAADLFTYVERMIGQLPNPPGTAD